ncbi:MAG: MFS transporter, partial [Chthoniobacterales bacterium]
DYDELQTGLRREGMYGAVAAFIGKVAFSSIGILSGYMLVWSGYVEADVQTPAAILNMRIFFAFIPAGFGIVGLVLTLFFPLTRKKVMAVRAAIDARRVAQSAMADT